MTHRLLDSTRTSTAFEANCGKSFFQFLIRLLLGGRQAEPYLWMVGRSNFNDDLAESEHLMMEDKEAHRSMGDRARFGARIKQITTGGETPIHAKGKKQFFAPCFRRLTLSLNCNPEAITILPPLTADIRDKLQLMKCSPATMLSDYAENVARFRKELPAFTHYLLHEFQIPPGMQDARFGVKAYVNPEIEEILLDFEPHLRLLEVIDLTFFKDGTEGIKETPSEIQGRLLSGPMGDVARQLLNYSTALGQLLARLAQEFPSRFQRTKSKGERRWNILPPEE